MDDRRINSAVRTLGLKEEKRFTKGTVITDPDELEKAAAAKDSGIDLQALHDSGVISGTWKGVKATKPESEAKGSKKEK
jgi:hypothetical protein